MKINLFYTILQAYTWFSVGYGVAKGSITEGLMFFNGLFIYLGIATITIELVILVIRMIRHYIKYYKEQIKTALEAVTMNRFQ